MKVFEIYSGQPKRFGMTLFEQLGFLIGLIPPLWLKMYWLLLICPVLFFLAARLLSQDEENFMVRIRNRLMPSFIRGKYERHTFSHRLIE